MAFKMANNGANNSANTEWFNNTITKDQFLKACKDNLPKTISNIVSVNDSYIVDSQRGVNLFECVDVDISKLTEKQKAVLLDYIMNIAANDNTYKKPLLKAILRILCFGGWNLCRKSNTTDRKGGIKL